MNSLTEVCTGRKSPVLIHYRAPEVQTVCLGSGYEVLKRQGERYLLGHTAEGFPFVIGKLKRAPSRFLGRNTTFEYYFESTELDIYGLINRNDPVCWRLLSCAA